MIFILFLVVKPFREEQLSHYRSGVFSRKIFLENRGEITIFKLIRGFLRRVAKAPPQVDPYSTENRVHDCGRIGYWALEFKKINNAAFTQKIWTGGYPPKDFGEIVRKTQFLFKMEILRKIS
jgi:hypothetical protein